MGSATMAFNKILVSVLQGSVAGQNTRTFPGFGLNSDVPSTTPVPILRYIDQQNNDGSYTYGYQSGDGSYKIETRLATGEGKVWLHRRQRQPEGDQLRCYGGSRVPAYRGRY